MASKPSLSLWSKGSTRSSIIDFVTDVTNPDNKNFIPPPRRISTFDNDGTLWCENPVVQAQFVFERVKAMLPDHPEWKNTYPFKAIVDGDLKSIVDDFYNGGKKLVQILYATHTGITQQEFCKIVKNFFDTSIHPRFNRSLKDIAYAPMVELLNYLRENEFKTYICSGGGTDFMRIVSEEIYGIVPENVIGSSIKTEFKLINGQVQMLRSPELFHFDDRDGKPTGIDHFIGRVPVISAGNVRAGGDIAMLTYCQSNELPSLQLLVNHDDARREYEYSESDNRSLNAAKENGWTVVSMKNDWKKIFAFE